MTTRTHLVPILGIGLERGFYVPVSLPCEPWRQPAPPPPKPVSHKRKTEPFHVIKEAKE